MIVNIKWSLERKMKVKHKGILIKKFVWLKSKMHSMLSDEESNTTKGINTTTEFNEFKETLFNKKIISTKWKELKEKNIKLEHTKSTKHYYRILMIKDLFQHGDIINRSKNSVFLRLKIYRNRQVFDLIRTSGIWMKPVMLRHQDSPWKF